MAATVVAVLSDNNAGQFEQEISAECAPLAVIAFRGSGEGNLTPGASSNVGADYRYGDTDLVTNGWEGVTLEGLFDTLAHSEYEGLRGDLIPVVPVGPADETEQFGYDAIMAILEAVSLDSALTFSGSKLLYSATRGAEAATHLMNEYLVKAEGCPIAPKFVIAGYSQGAMAARHTAELNPEHVLGVVTIGDPYQMPDGPGVRADGASGNGIIRWKADDIQRGQLDAYYGSTDLGSSICHAGDPICEFTPVGGLVKLATGNYDEHTDYYSETYPDEAIEDATEILRLAHQQWLLALAAKDAGHTVQWDECKAGNAELRSQSLSLVGTPTFFSAISPDHLCTEMVYEFDLDGDGIFETISTNGTIWTTFDAEGPHTIGVRVTNPETGEQTQTQQSITVLPSDSTEIYFDQDGTLVEDPQVIEPDDSASEPEPEPESDDTPANTVQDETPTRSVSDDTPSRTTPDRTPTDTTLRPHPSPPSGLNPTPALPPVLRPVPDPAPVPDPGPTPDTTPDPQPDPAPEPEPRAFALDTRHAFPGSTLHVSGTSVPPGSEVVVRTDDPRLVAHGDGSAGDDGTVNVGVTMPSEGIVPDDYDLYVEVDGELADTLTFSLWDPWVALEGAPVQAGQSLVVTGRGFAPHTTVHAYGDFGFSSAWQTNADGDFIEREIPVGSDVQPGMHTVAFQLGNPGPIHSETFEVLQGPEFTLDVTDAFPGNELLVSGTSVPPGSEVVVRTDDPRLFAQGEGSPGDDGAVDVVVPLPHQGIVPDDYDLYVEVDGELIETLTFSLWAPTVHVEGSPVLPGGSVLVSGEGFAPDTLVHMSPGGAFAGMYGVTNAAGSFSDWELEIPDTVAPGIYDLTFRLLDRSPLFTTQIEVLPGPDPMDPPEFTLETPHAFPGSGLWVNGTSLYAGSEVVVRTNHPDLMLEASRIAGDSGWVGIPLTVPNQGIVAGEYALEVVVDGEVADTLTFWLWDPTVEVETAPLYPGDTIDVTGAGFAPDSEFYVVAPFGYQATWLTDATGALTGQSIPIPSGADPQEYDLTFQLGQSGPTLTKRIEVLAQPAPVGPPEFSISGQHAFPGSELFIAGTSVPPGSLVMVRTTDPALALQEVGVAQGTGWVQVAVPMPNQGITPGTYNLEITVDGDLAETFTVALWNPSVQLGAMLAGSGNGLVASGQGFAPHTTVYVYDEWGAETTLVTNAAGAFVDEPISMNSDVAPGTYVLEFHMGHSGPIVHQFTNVMANPKITVNSVSLDQQNQFEISRNQNVTIEGSGFFANEALVVESYVPGDEDTPGGQQTITTNASGRFNLGFSFSTSPAGEYRYDITYINAVGTSVTDTFTIVVVD